MKKNRVVLAFSGGLDTSYCAKYLTAVKNLEVYSVLVNTGGFSQDEIKETEQKAYELGVAKHVTLEETENFYQDFIKYLVFGNVLKNNSYPLSVSAERVVQAISVAKYAKKSQAAFVAHGSTGAGNDQVRFDMIFNIIIPEVEILTPVRDQKISRNEEISFLKSFGINVNEQKAQYSINKGLWGTSVGGKETLTSNLPLPQEAFPSEVLKAVQEDISLTFEKGEVKAINGVPYASSVEAIERLSGIASAFGIGRDIHVGDTIIGIKGRVGFEAAAPMIIIKAHHALEKHVLTKSQLYWKDLLSASYGNMLHEGLYLDPVMRNIEKFLEDSQKNVTGTVNLTLNPYRFSINGIASPYDLMSEEFGSYGEMNQGWTGEDVKGFAKINGNALKIWHRVNTYNETTVRDKVSPEEKLKLV
jgi:argininosuccinate synthase